MDVNELVDITSVQGIGIVPEYLDHFESVKWVIDAKPENLRCDQTFSNSGRQPIDSPSSHNSLDWHRSIIHKRKCVTCRGRFWSAKGRIVVKSCTLSSINLRNDDVKDLVMQRIQPETINY